MMRLHRVCAALAALLLFPATTRAVEVGFALSDPSLGMPGGYFHMGSSEGMARVTALFEVATYMESIITNPGTLTFELSTFSEAGTTLAKGGEYYSMVPGMASGVVLGDAQSELLMGTPVAGANATLSFNTTKMFYLGSDPMAIPGDLHDFRSVALHEMSHGLGWQSAMMLDKTSALTDALKASDPTFYAGLGEVFTKYDTFLVDGMGMPLILPGGAANPDASLGEKIASPNAIEAYGGELVPTATIPFPFVYDNTHLGASVPSVMNKTLGEGVIERTWTSVDVAILKDIGYAVVPAPSSLLTGLIGIVPCAVLVLRRRKTNRAAEKPENATLQP